MVWMRHAAPPANQRPEPAAPALTLSDETRGAGDHDDVEGDDQDALPGSKDDVLTEDLRILVREGCVTLEAARAMGGEQSPPVTIQAHGGESGDGDVGDDKKDLSC